MDEMSNKKPDKVDEEMIHQLLSENPPPTAPDWFEARLMARIRTEIPGGQSVNWLSRFHLVRVLAVGAVAALVAIAVIQWEWDGTIASGDNKLSQKQLNEALDALVSYQEESDQWTYEIF